MIAKVQFSLEAVEEVEVEDGIVHRSLHADLGGRVRAIAVYDENDDVVAEYTSTRYGGRAELAMVGSPLTWDLGFAIEDAARRASVEYPKPLVGSWVTVGKENSPPYRRGYEALAENPLRYRLELPYALRLVGGMVPAPETTEDMPIFALPLGVLPPATHFGTDGTIAYVEDQPLADGSRVLVRIVINKTGEVYRITLGPPGLPPLG